MKAGVLFQVPELSWRKWRKLAGKNKEDADSSKNRKCGGRRFLIMVATQNKCLVTAFRGRCGRVQRIRRRLFGTQSSGTSQIEAKTRRNYNDIEYLDFCMNRP